MEDLPEMIKIIVYASTNKVGSECTDSFEIERSEWESMSDDEKEEMCRDMAFEFIEWGWYES